MGDKYLTVLRKKYLHEPRVQVERCVLIHLRRVPNKVGDFPFETSYYWDTCGSPVIKCLCFFVVHMLITRVIPQHHDN